MELKINSCEVVDSNVLHTHKPIFKEKYLNHFFELKEETILLIQSLKPQFGYNGYGEFIFYRTYSRIKKDGFNENWNDCVIRVINGIFSIRKDWYIKNDIYWDENYWQVFAKDMAISMFEMNWLPAGRGLWTLGTDYITNRGGLALHNCAFVDLLNLPTDYEWMMDALMNGVGVGFGITQKIDINLYKNNPKAIKIIIGDSREEWCESVRILLESFLNPNQSTVEFLYNEIRPKGLPIKGFGGRSSGPEPLIDLHEKIRDFMKKYMIDNSYTPSMLKADISNMIGCCVVAGNVRRSAQICLGNVDDQDFLNLKEYDLDKMKYRSKFGWMSNNSIGLKQHNDFENLFEVSKRVVKKGDPGLVNLVNFKYGRIGKNDNIIPDSATGINPCGEQPLESYEVCDLAEVFKTRCKTIESWFNACKYATFCSVTVTLVKTHFEQTNEVIEKNRRIGVSQADFTGWKSIDGTAKVIRYLREGYKVIRNAADFYADSANINRPIRVTTIKPGGTIPKMVGVTSGASYPNFEFGIRRTRIQQGSPMYKILDEHKIPHEPDVLSKNTEVFEYPIKQGPARVVTDVSVWEQAMNVVLLQREYADNAVSNTLTFRPKWKLTSYKEFVEISSYEDYVRSILLEYTFDPKFMEMDIFKSFEIIMKDCLKLNTNYDDVNGVYDVQLFEFDPQHEENQIEALLASIAPCIKSISLMPYAPFGIYPQMPEEAITEEEYNKRLESIVPIDWSKFKGDDGVGENFCTGDKCELQTSSLITG